MHIYYDNNNNIFSKDKKNYLIRSILDSNKRKVAKPILNLMKFCIYVNMVYFNLLNFDERSPYKLWITEFYNAELVLNKNVPFV